jgi:hypothetical protein
MNMGISCVHLHHAPIRQVMGVGMLVVGTHLMFTSVLPNALNTEVNHVLPPYQDVPMRQPITKTLRLLKTMVPVRTNMFVLVVPPIPLAMLEPLEPSNVRRVMHNMCLLAMNAKPIPTKMV